MTDEQKWSYYVELWRKLLREVGGWPDDRIQAFIDERERSWSDMGFHESAAYWVIPLLVSPKVWTSIGLQRGNRLHSRLDREISSRCDGVPPDEVPWDDVRRAFAGVVSKFEAS